MTTRRQRPIRERVARAALPAALVALLQVGTPGEARQGSLAFGTPIRLTPSTSGGYEPMVVADDAGHVVVSAHKENSTLAASVNPDGAPARATSWMWLSSDGGRTFGDLRGHAAHADALPPAIEGGVSLADGSLYLADGGAGTILTRWSLAGETATVDFSRPISTGRLDDRNWIAARGNAVVFATNNGSTGAGRYTLYTSRDRGQSFGSGVGVPNSGWCTPAADPHPRVRRFYVVCSYDDREGAFVLVSGDDGATFKRAHVHGSRGEWALFPSVAADGRGNVYAVATVGPFGANEETTVVAAVSRDYGRTWRQTALPLPRGRYDYPVVAATRAGTLGLAAYFRPNRASAWRVHAAVWDPGRRQRPRPVTVDTPDAPAAAADAQYPSGDLMGAAFNSEGRLVVSWTRVVVHTNATGATAQLHRDIYVATQR